MSEVITRVHRITLNNGTVLEDCDVGHYEDDEYIWCFLKNISLVEAFQLFSVPENIETIIFEYGMSNQYTKTTYSGYNKIKSITQRTGGVNVGLCGTYTDIHEDFIVNGEPVRKVGEENDGTIYNQDTDQP